MVVTGATMKYSKSRGYLLGFLFACWSISTAQANILVVAPHPDDDIITSAGVIYSAVKRGEAVTVVYMTNGDLNGTSVGYQRQNEAVTAQVQYLGMSEDNLVFLGYPDGGLRDLYDYYPNATDHYVSPNGQGTTYGNRGLGRSDYHTYQFGAPANYNLANAVLDLQTVIQTYKPDRIFTLSEYDHHTDHSTTYLIAQMALSNLRTLLPNYTPAVHKTIVWSGREDIWPVPADPTAYNAVVPDLGTTPLAWNDRESLDVPLPMQDPNLLANVKYQAIQAHASQAGADSFISKFAHKDEIFWTEDPRGTNPPPIVNAGFDITANEGVLVSLNGTASKDPNGGSLSYRWTQTGGIAVTLANAASATPSFTAPAGLTHDELLTFQLVVSDGSFNSPPDSVTVKVTAANPSPNIAPLASITASAENSSAGQLAIKVADGVIDGYPGDYTREWAAPNQGVGAWIQLSWTTPYVIDRVMLFDRPNPGDQILGGTLTFSDGSTVTVGPLYNNGAGTQFIFAPRVATGVKLTVTKVGPGTSNVGLAEFQVFGKQDTSYNYPPIARAGANQTVQEGTSVLLDGTASSDPNGSALSFQWTQTGGPGVTLANAATATPSFTAPSGLTHNTALTFQLVVSDGQLNSDPASITVTVTAANPTPNIAPLASVTASSQNSTTGQLAIKAVDNVIDGYPGDYTREWAAQSQGVGAWILLSWASPYLVDRIVLYDRPNSSDQIMSATLTFSDGSTVAVGTLPNNGAGSEILFAPRSVTSVKLTVTGVSSTTGNVGLAEFQVFGSP